MVGYADERPGNQIVHPGFLLNLPDSGHSDILARFLMPLGKVPESVSPDKKVVPASVADQTSCGIDLLEFPAYCPVCAFRVIRRNVNPLQGRGDFEQAYE